MRLLAKTRVYVQRATDFCSGGISGGKQKKTRTTGITTTSHACSRIIILEGQPRPCRVRADLFAIMGVADFLSLLLAPFFEAILRLGLKLTGLTSAWDANIIVKDPRALAAICLKGDLGLGVSSMVVISIAQHQHTAVPTRS
jgi:hypothetical protein